MNAPTNQAASIYCDLMEESRSRIALLRRITIGSLRHGTENFEYECASLQLRKVLESIAFGSLCVNEPAYAKTHANFEKHHRAKDLLRALEKVNPHFYPTPMRSGQSMTPGVKHLDRVDDRFLTPNEFVNLYDTCNKVLHVWNPFSRDARHVKFGRTVAEWVDRSQRLRDLHLMHVAGSDDVWVIQMVSPEDGKVHAFPASPGTL
jgi:hypothetical protein